MLHSFILRRKKNERAVRLIPEVSRILARGTKSRHNERNLHLTYKIPMKYRDRGISIYFKISFTANGPTDLVTKI